MIKILITGANGFVGSHILENMMPNANIQVIAACRDRNKLITAFKGEVREGDLNDPSYLEGLLEDIDVVCHAAAWTALWAHEKESKRLYLRPSVNLIDAAIRKGVKRFINVSTTSANPEHSANALSTGIKTSFWPHLNNVIEIENTMKNRSEEGCQMINLRLGLFTGERYGLGLLPVLLPRLKTHLVPWVDAGKTAMPIIDGKDIGRAFTLASTANISEQYQAFNIIGPEIPSTREVLTFINQHYGYPKPHFSVPFFIAYKFALLMECLNPFVPWEPLVTRSIIHLLEQTHVSNQKASEILGYEAKIGWQDSVKKQIDLLQKNQLTAMRMSKPVT